METEYKDGYTFYVLTTPAEGDTTINLIMDQNIYSDGTPAGMTGVTQATNATQYNLVAWLSIEDYQTNGGPNIEQFTDEGACQYGGICAITELGPVTAMTYLYNATKDWTNVEPVNYTYNDKTTQGTTNADTSYTSFVSTNGVATITPLSGDGVTIGTSDEPLRARMPIYASDASITEVASKTDANAYLYDNLDPDGNAAPYGYWTLSSNADLSNYAWVVACYGYVHDIRVWNDSSLGVRPVINLKI